MNKKIPIIITTMATCLMTCFSIYNTQYKSTNAEENQTTTITCTTQDYGEGVTTITSNGTFKRHVTNEEVTYTQIRSTKINSYWNNNYSIIKANNYIQEYIEQTTPSMDTNYRIFEVFFIYQIRPYNTINVTNSTLNITFGGLDVLEEYNLINYRLEIDDIYQTTQSNYANYLNMQNFTNHFFSINQYEEAISNTNKTKLANEHIINDASNINNYSMTLNNVNIEQDKTTYIFGYAQLREITDIYTANVNHKIKAKTLTITGLILPRINNVEVIDIWGLMLNILTMPFSFISTAFNVTIFEGTPYQFNISNILMSIIAITLLLWIIKLILGKANIGEFIGNQSAQYNDKKARKTAELNKQHEKDQQGK